MMTSLTRPSSNDKLGFDRHAIIDNDASESSVWPVALLFYGQRPHPFTTVLVGRHFEMKRDYGGRRQGRQNLIRSGN